MATITVAEFAVEIDTDPRTARRFLRSITPRDAQPGKGSRWAIEKRDLRSLRAKFAKFEQAEQAKRDARAATDAAASTEPTIDDIDAEPTDAELAELRDIALDAN